MKHILTLLILSTLLSSAVAQDIIIKTSGDVIKGYEVDMTEKSIYYKLTPEGDDVKSISKKELIMIKKEDGSVLSFVEDTTSTVESAESAESADGAEGEDSQTKATSSFSGETAEILYNMPELGRGANYILSLKRSKMGGWSIQTKVTDIKRESDKIEIEYLYTFLNKKGTKQSPNAKLAGFGDGFYISTIIEDNAWRVTHDYIFGYAKNMSISGYVVEIPYDINVGDKLKTSSLYIKGEFMKKEFLCELNYEDFVVVGQEDITTLAGTFNCYKIEGRLTGEYNSLELDASQEWWVNKEIGIVKIATDYYGGMEYVLDSLSK